MMFREASASYSASDFNATSPFYEEVLGLERVTDWDRPETSYDTLDTGTASEATWDSRRR